jgi:hypothetical protein
MTGRMRQEICDNKPIAANNAELFGNQIVAHNVTLRPSTLQCREAPPADTKGICAGFVLNLGSAWKFSAPDTVFVKMLLALVREFKRHGET